MDLGFHLAMSYRDLKHPTSRKNFAAVVGQNHALILTQCHMDQTMPDPTMGANRNLNDLNTSVTYFLYKRGDYIDWNVRSVLVL